MNPAKCTSSRIVTAPLAILAQSEWEGISLQKWPVNGLIVSGQKNFVRGVDELSGATFFTDVTFHGDTISPAYSWKKTVLEHPAVIKPYRLACQAVRESPVFIWTDVKAFPLVSAGVLVGLCGLSFAGVMDIVGPWIFAGGAVTSAWMLLNGGLGLHCAVKTQNQTAAEAAARDIGIGIFSMTTMAVSSGLLAGLHHFGALPEKGGNFDGFVQALTAVLHSSDEIAMGVVIAGRIIRGQRKGNS